MTVLPGFNPPLYQFSYFFDDQTVTSIRTRKRIEFGEICVLTRLLPRLLPLPAMSSDWMFNRMKPEQFSIAFASTPEIGAGLPFYQVSLHSLSTLDYTFIMINQHNPTQWVTVFHPVFLRLILLEEPFAERQNVWRGELIKNSWTDAPGVSYKKRFLISRKQCFRYVYQLLRPEFITVS